MKTWYVVAVFVLLLTPSGVLAQPAVAIKGAGPFDTHEKLVEAIKAQGLVVVVRRSNHFNKMDKI